MSIFEPALQENQPVASRLLSSALMRASLSNAYLLTGRSYADKWLLSIQLAAFLNCLNREYLSEKQSSCLTDKSLNSETSMLSFCQNCRWIKEDKHPQALIKLNGEGASGQIPVEKVRLLSEELGKTSVYMRVIVIANAAQNCLHAASANALLKNIEEPQDNTVFILFAPSADQVLPTIVSRSQQIELSTAFKPGFWIPEPENSTDSPSEDKLNAVKAEFMHETRKRLSGNSGLHGSYLKSVLESQEMSKRLTELCEDGLNAGLLIDLYLAAELSILREKSSSRSSICQYLSSLAELCENAKNQLDHYVRPQNVLETFSYSLTELRLKHLGDFHLAKN